MVGRRDGHAFSFSFDTIELDRWSSIIYVVVVCVDMCRNRMV